MITWEPVLRPEDERDAEDAKELTPFGVREQGPVARTLLELPILLVAAGVLAWLLKLVVAQAFYIPSESMYPQLKRLDRVVVSKLAYRLHDPRRGDIVVFDCPPLASCKPMIDPPSNPLARVIRAVGQGVGVVQPSTDEYIKRVIALPGETVEGRDDAVFVDGKRLEEPYLPEGTTTHPFPPRQVPAGALWVMGDNRAGSSDSRVFGPIKESTVVGRAFVRIWPLGRTAFL